MEIKNKKSNSTFLWLVVALLILLVFNIVTIIDISNNRKIICEFQSIIAKEQIENNNKSDIIYKNMELQLMFNHSLNHDFCDSVLMHESKVLLIFNGNGCNQCILSLIMDLNILSERIGKENVILVGDFDNNKALDDYLLNIHNDFKSILFKDILNIGSIKIDKPILLIIDPDYNTNFVFYNPEGVPSVKSIYFDELIKGYFSDVYINQNKL